MHTLRGRQIEENKTCIENGVEASTRQDNEVNRHRLHNVNIHGQLEGPKFKEPFLRVGPGTRRGASFCEITEEQDLTVALGSWTGALNYFVSTESQRHNLHG